MSGLVKRQNPHPWRPAPGLGRRPATPPANARELALKSHARQLRREGLDRRAAEVMLAARSASGAAKGPAPRKRATSRRKAPPRVSSSSYIEEAKLLRARLRSRRSRTQEELAALHGKGEAFLSPGGKYYAAANEEDLIASIKAV